MREYPLIGNFVAIIWVAGMALIANRHLILVLIAAFLLGFIFGRI